MEKIYENIRKIRLIKGYSQQNMADDLKISQRHYARIEKGTVDVSYSVLCKIADILAVEINYLFDIEKTMALNKQHASHNPAEFAALNAIGSDGVTRLYERIINEKDSTISSLKNLVESKNELLKLRLKK